MNAEQVRKGMAWVYRKYTAKDSPLYALERAAIGNQSGIWSHKNPIPPWDYRRQKRGKTAHNKKTARLNCSPRKTCSAMTSCKEAYYHLTSCGNGRLDRDKDGIPCESICGG
ncbi:thermonuclease family protein [Candidatus Venteria ishoeyi]|uniref:thermonuclease family protein n=1 Tax=Candidatus Venteria ishoeyi TaxID=1899563 RepID=UPI000CDE88A5|nr:excalibur calcium-binding domain-containing protein [Candidatus Venteria ishoeyi]